MKNAISRALSIAVVGGLLGGCIGAPVHVQTVPAAIKLSGYGRPVKGQACGFQLLLLIPISINSRGERAYAEMVENAQGDPITNVQVEEGWFYGFVGTGYCTRFRGTAFHLEPGAMPAAPIANPSAMVAPPNYVTVPAIAAATPAVAGPSVALPAPPAMSARPMQEVQTVMGYQKAAFDRAVAMVTNGDRTPGTVVVNFTVQPDGSVNQAQLVSSTSANVRVQGAVLGQLSKVVFQAKNVPAQQVVGYAIAVN